MNDADTLPPQRILIIKPSSLGDVTHSLPVLCLLRRRWPKAHISWLVAPACAGLLEGLKELDQVILFDRRRLGAAWWNPAALAALWRFLRQLRQERFDLVVDLQGLFRSGILGWLSGARRRIGFANAREGAWLFYNQRVPIDNLEQHALDRYLKIAAALGCPDGPLEFPLPTTQADRQYVDRLLGDIGRFAVLMPAANWLSKRWPAERFAELVQPLRQQMGLNCVVAGGPDATALAAAITGNAAATHASAAGAPTGAIREKPEPPVGALAALDLTGKTNLRQLIALLQRADLVIANDSGPMHIAAALGKPLVSIFGPTNPVRTGPYQRMESVVRVPVPCQPCYKRQCPLAEQICLTRLSVDRVIEAARRQMSR